jgi:hypothetical protein
MARRITTIGTGSNTIYLEGKRAVFYCAYLWCAFLGALAMLSASFAFAVIGKREADSLKNGFSDLVDSWDADRIYAVSSSAPSSLPSSDHYLKTVSGVWPGTIEGCYCTDSNSRRKVTRGLKTRSCNTNETIVGCTSVDSTPRMELIN